MRSLFLASRMLGLCVIIIAEASRHSEYAYRRGYGPNIKHSVPPVHRADAAGDQTVYRFLNNNTRPFKVDALPDIPFDVGEMYAGSIPINLKDPKRALFFIFQPKLGAPVDEITIWLNGGPGCSSLEGFLQENGRFIWSWGQYSPALNPYSWVNLTNMLWVEHPVGTGFSTGRVKARSEYDISYDFIDFFMNFQVAFGIKNFKIYVTGESYAGRYVPYISSVMIDRHNTTYYNISGALIYDPVIGNYIHTQQQVPITPFVLKNNNVLNLNTSFLTRLQALDKSCGYADYRTKYLTFPPSSKQPAVYFNNSNPKYQVCDLWGLTVTATLQVNPCANVYQIATLCPIPSDPLGFPTDLIYSYPGLPVYFDRTDVKIALHAPLNVSWSLCSGPVFVPPSPNSTTDSSGPEDSNDRSPDPIHSILPQVINHTKRVLIANADLDMEVITEGTMLAVQNMTWGGKMGFQSKPATDIVIGLLDLQYGEVFEQNGMERGTGQGIMGVQHFERGLSTLTSCFENCPPKIVVSKVYAGFMWRMGWK